jgi:U3 small nucleolar RNA-associated protein 20
MLVQLARDLGEDFYRKYWQRTLTLLSQTVNHLDFPVIEASFNTLSWLFKYLSRPLVLNFDTTFHQIAPLLGKQSQKQYVLRFASEAFAFLLRRLKESPSDIVKTILDDVTEGEYAEAVANVFIETMKAPSRTLHSKAVPLFNSLIDYVVHSENSVAREIVRSLLEQMIYNTTKQSFSPLLQCVIGLLESEAHELGVYLLLLCCTVKGGVRITDWTALSSSLLAFLTRTNINSKELCLLIATVISKSDPLVSKSFTQKVFEILRNQDSSSSLFILVRLVAKLNAIYFQKWVLEEFVK